MPAWSSRCWLCRRGRDRGRAIAFIRRRIEDSVLETVIALVTHAAAHVLAEAVQTSGVTAVVVAAVILGKHAPTLTNDGIRLQLGAVFGTVGFRLKSVVFSLIGLHLLPPIRQLLATARRDADRDPRRKGVPVVGAACPARSRFRR